MASTSTRPFDSAAMAKPHRIDLANESSTERRSSAIGAARAERLVRLHQHHARTDTLELDDPALAALAAVETEVVRTEAGRQAGRQQELEVEPRNLEQHRAGPFVPVQREEAVDFERPRCDRRWWPGPGRAGGACCAPIGVMATSSATNRDTLNLDMDSPRSAFYVAPAQGPHASGARSPGRRALPGWADAARPWTRLPRHVPGLTCACPFGALALRDSAPWRFQR